MPKYKCLKCGKVWVGGVLLKNGRIRKPKQCIRCKNPNWNRCRMIRKRKNKWRS